VPVHYALTKRKLLMLDRLTAKHTNCVYVWSKLFNEPDERPGEPRSRKHVDIAVSERRISGQLQKDRIRDCGSVTALGAVV
jgi:hypothetical protein